MNESPRKQARNRMADVIRSAISDQEVMECLTHDDLMNVLTDAVDSLSPSEVRGFIYRCFSSNEPKKGLIMVDKAIAYAVGMEREGSHKISAEIVGAVVGTLSILSESTPSVKNKLDELMGHSSPAVVAAAVENLGHSSSMENFNRVCELLTNNEFRVAIAAARYVEACARDAAFRRRREKYVIEDAAEEFLRRALVPLERTYNKLKARQGPESNIQKRIAILVAMIYSEILDSTDWKRTKSEDVEERIYYTLEEHLHENIGHYALPYLCKMIERDDLEEGTKLSALHTVGRMSKKEAHRSYISSWINRYLKKETLPSLVNTSKKIQKACFEKTLFSPVPNSADDADRSSIVPRAAGAPPKLSK